MKKQELCACFDRIKPNEALISDTLARINERRQVTESPVRRMSPYAFATRLVGAMCALVLLIGIGVTVGKDAIMSPDMLAASDERMSPMTADAEDTPRELSEADTVDMAEAQALVARAKEQGGEWAVMAADVLAVYFLDLTDEDVAAGIACRCAVALQTTAVAEMHTEHEDTLRAESFVASIAFEEVADASVLMDAMGSSLLVRLCASAQNGETVWTVEEYCSVEAE